MNPTNRPAPVNGTNRPIDPEHDVSNFNTEAGAISNVVIVPCDPALAGQIEEANDALEESFTPSNSGTDKRILMCE